MNKVQNTELVDASLSVEYKAIEPTISFEGDYPLRINGHFVVAATECDGLRFICATCGKEVETSEALWRSATASKRRGAVRYVVGHFVEQNCNTPIELEDIVGSVIEGYIGGPSHPELVHNIERELTQELTGYG